MPTHQEMTHRNIDKLASATQLAPPQMASPIVWSDTNTTPTSKVCPLRGPRKVLKLAQVKAQVGLFQPFFNFFKHHAPAVLHI